MGAKKPKGDGRNQTHIRGELDNQRVFQLSEEHAHSFALAGDVLSDLSHMNKDELNMSIDRHVNNALQAQDPVQALDVLLERLDAAPELLNQLSIEQRQALEQRKEDVKRLQQQIQQNAPTPFDAPPSGF